MSILTNIVLIIVIISNFSIIDNTLIIAIVRIIMTAQVGIVQLSNSCLICAFECMMVALLWFVAGNLASDCA